MHGLDVMLWCCAGIALAAALLALAFLPRQAGGPASRPRPPSRPAFPSCSRPAAGSGTPPSRYASRSREGRMTTMSEAPAAARP